MAELKIDSFDCGPEGHKFSALMRENRQGLLTAEKTFEETVIL